MLLDGVGNCALQKASRGPWSAPVRLPDHQGRDCPTEDHQCECHTRQTVTHDKDAHEIKPVFTLHTFSEGEGADPFYRFHLNGLGLPSSFYRCLSARLSIPLTER